MTTPRHDNEGALFEALNAKKLTPSEIAAGFVICSQYEQLVGPDHSYLVGPRGSGKTTLLRMLEGDALMQWEHRRAPEFRRRVRFSSVFLPADQLWAAQLRGHGDFELSGRIGVAAFGTQMLYSLLETLKYRLGYYHSAESIHLPTELRHRSEVELVHECAEAWGLNLRASSIIALQQALELRLFEISNLIEDEDPDPAQITALSWLRYSPWAMFRYGVRAINRHTLQPNHRWGLLLDEMELAPPPVHASILANVRGGDKSIVVKLSFSPFDRFIGSNQMVGDAVADNDFKPIYLWYGSRLGGRRFTAGLWRRMITERFPYRSATAVLGPSKIDITGGTAQARNSYAQDGSEIALLAKAADDDPGLASFLSSYDIDLQAVDTLAYPVRSATIRKIYPLVVFRNALLDFEGGVPQRKQRRKVTDCFTGVDAVFAALEGNPRWIKAVFSQFLAIYEGGGRIPEGTQYDILIDAAERFESLLRVLAPTPAIEPKGQPHGNGDFSVLDLLDAISTYFSQRNLGQFSADPPSVFKVDRKVSAQVLVALETALSAGAVIHLRGKASPPVLPTLVGERFRLAYLLTIREKKEIPFRIGKAVALSRILRDFPSGDHSIRRSRLTVPRADPGTIPMWEIEG
jgi:hypothetical protein